MPRLLIWTAGHQSRRVPSAAKSVTSGSQHRGLYGLLWPAIKRDVLRLFIVALPVLLAGTWLGLKLSGKLNEAPFRKLVLVLLLVSGAVLLFR